jgi:hypothetical protein
MNAQRNKKKRPIVVEDHGNGFMVLGTTVIAQALKVLEDYVETTEPYKCAMPCWYGDRPSVWLTTGPGEVWEGAVNHMGEVFRLHGGRREGGRRN